MVGSGAAASLRTGRHPNPGLAQIIKLSDLGLRLRGLLAGGRVEDKDLAGVLRELGLVVVVGSEAAPNAKRRRDPRPTTIRHYPSPHLGKVRDLALESNLVV